MHRISNVYLEKIVGIFNLDAKHFYLILNYSCPSPDRTFKNLIGSLTIDNFCAVQICRSTFIEALELWNARSDVIAKCKTVSCSLLSWLISTQWVVCWSLNGLSPDDPSTDGLGANGLSPNGLSTYGLLKNGLNYLRLNYQKSLKQVSHLNAKNVLRHF